MRYFCYIILSICFFDCNGQKNNALNSPYNALIESIFFDSSVQNSGSLIPIPNDNIYKPEKPNIIHLSIYEKKNQESIDIIKGTFNSSVVFIESNKPKLIFDSHLIDTNYSVYSNTNYHVLGTIIITGVYTHQKTKDSPIDEIYFDIIRIGSKSKKSQITQIFKLLKKNEKWFVEKNIILTRS
jgi:hypothetical protein